MQTCGVCSNNGLTMRHNTIHVQPTNKPLIQRWRRRRRRESVCDENTEMNRSIIRLFIYFLHLPSRRELLSSTRLCGKSQCDIENGRHFFHLSWSPCHNVVSFSLRWNDMTLGISSSYIIIAMCSNISELKLFNCELLFTAIRWWNESDNLLVLCCSIGGFGFGIWHKSIFNLLLMLR